jgi:hypothetical protein
VTGHIFVVPLGADPSRVRLLTDKLAAQRLDIILGTQGADYSAHRSDAAAVIVTFGLFTASTTELAELPHPLPSEARVGKLIVVTLEPGAVLPAAETLKVPSIDLTDWYGGGSAEFQQLVHYLRSLVNQTMAPPYGLTLQDTWPVQQARNSVAEIKRHTASIGRLREILVDDGEHTRQLREALSEVGRTYRVAKLAIERFFEAGDASTRINTSAYAKLERGLLAQAIANGRGHCGRINTLYNRIGGLRLAVEPRVTADLLKELDHAFERLGTADGELFDAMTLLGTALTGQSRIIVTHLLTGQEELARKAIVEARTLLLLEEELDDALAAFQAIETSLGYAEPIPGETGAIHVSIQNINVAGSIVGSNIVAAETIENSSVVAANAPISDELKRNLLHLHHAVAELTRSLPDDESALAARDLEDLTKEVTSPNPRPAFWRRAADGLLAAAKMASGIGLPVIDLVTKVVTHLA